MGIRKQLDDLILDDILKFPSWEFALDEEGTPGQNEQTVRPLLSVPPLDPANNYLVVRATFQLADGTEYKGLIKPIRSEGGLLPPLIPIDLFPIILTNQGRVNFWYGMFKPDSRELVNNYSMLGKENPAKIFPIKFSSDVEIVNGIFEGILTGFMYSDPDVEPMDLSMDNVKTVM